MGCIIASNVELVYKYNNFRVLYKEYGIEGRFNWRGPSHHIIIHALQTVLHLNKNYLSDVQLPRIQ